MSKHNKTRQALYLILSSGALFSAALTVTACETKNPDSREEIEGKTQCPEARNCSDDGEEQETSNIENADDEIESTADAFPKDAPVDPGPDDESPDDSGPELSLQDLRLFNQHCDRKVISLPDIQHGAFGITGVEMLDRAGRSFDFILDVGLDENASNRVHPRPASQGQNARIVVKPKPSGSFSHIIPFDTNFPADRDGCVEQLDMEVIIGFESEDGAFSEQLEGQLSTFNTQDPEVKQTMTQLGLTRLPFDSWILTDATTDELQGAIRFEVQPRSGESCSDSLEMQIQALMSGGALQDFQLRVLGECSRGEGPAGVYLQYCDNIYRNRR